MIQTKGTVFELHAIPEGHTYFAPNTFINFAAPIVNVPYHNFFLATVIGLIPAAYVTVRAGIALGDLQSVKDLYDFQSIATLFFIGVVSIMPTLISKKDS